MQGAGILCRPHIDVFTGGGHSSSGVVSWNVLVQAVSSLAAWENVALLHGDFALRLATEEGPFLRVGMPSNRQRGACQGLGL